MKIIIHVFNLALIKKEFLEKLKNKWRSLFLTFSFSPDLKKKGKLKRSTFIVTIIVAIDLFSSIVAGNRGCVTTLDTNEHRWNIHALFSSVPVGYY